MDTYYQWLAIALFICMAGLFIWAAIATSILKDASTATVAPYSLSRTLLMWWTTVIALCVIAHYGFTGDFLSLNKTVLVLMGISLGTSGLAKVIDNSDERAEVAKLDAQLALPATEVPRRHQDDDSASFIGDILSDENGPSAHRLQVVAFNFIYGVLFVGKFWSDPAHTLPDFGDMELAILGISASGYLYLKNTENE